MLGGVGVGWIEGSGLLDFEKVTVTINFLKEAGLMAGVAGATSLFDFKKKGVHVAIDVEFEHFLGVPARLTFEPEFLAGAAPIVHEPGVEGGFERGGVHPSHHEHAMRGGVLDDGWNETVGGIFQG